MRVNTLTRCRELLGQGLFAMLLVCSTVPIGHADVIDTNRPGFSFTPAVVGEQNWQLETALTYLQSDNGLRQWSLPNAELRYGVGSDVEVFLSGIRWIDADLGSTSASGLGDIALEGEFTRSFATASQLMRFQASVKMPTGDHENEVEHEGNQVKVPLGTGSWDVMLRGQYTRSTERFGLLFGQLVE